MSGSDRSPGGRGAMWSSGEAAPSPPISSERRAGIGCNININDRQELFVRKVIPGGPAAFSCEIAMGDVLTKVDGVNVIGETPEEVARRIVGPERDAITMCFRIRCRNSSSEQVVRLDNEVTLIRQHPVSIPDKLVKPQVGLGVELGKMDSGHMVVRSLVPGGAAALSGKLRVGDVICTVDGKDVTKLPPGIDKPQLLLGLPYSRISLQVQRGRQVIHLEMVRTVTLMGEYLMKHTAYLKSLEHAILPPTPPTELGAGLGPRNAPAPMPGRPTLQLSNVAPSQGLPTLGVQVMSSIGGSQSGKFNRVDMSRLDAKFERVMDVAASQPTVDVDDALCTTGISNFSEQRPFESPGPYEARQGRKRTPLLSSPSPKHGVISSSHAGMVAAGQSPMWRNGAELVHIGGSNGGLFGSAMSSSRDASLEKSSLNSVDGMLSRSSTSSRDSIALSVRCLFGEAYDALRTVEGRESTFTDDWPHRGNPRLLKSKMANAGFIYTPEGETNDKVTCVYCGLELGFWEPADDPWAEHHDNEPGCSFWRRSSLVGERMSKEMLFTGYGSPYHSFHRSAGADMQAALQRTLTAGGHA